MEHIIAQEYLAGTGLYKLARRYHKDWSTIRRILCEQGVEIRKPTPQKIATEEAVKLYESGQSTNKIAEQYGISNVSVLDHLERAGIKRRPPTVTSRKYDIDLTLLTDLSTETASYWFGFMLADGYINLKNHRNGKHVLRCQLAERDIGHLYNLCKDAGLVALPKRIEQKDPTSFGFGHMLTYLGISSKELIDCYEQWGWFDFKNGIVDNFPPPGANVRHLLRGLWDGDGVVTVGGDSSRYLRVGFCDKHFPVVDKVRSLVVEECSVRENKISYPNGIPCVFWAGSPAVTIARWLYTNQTRCLQRKLLKILPHLNRPAKSLTTAPPRSNIRPAASGRR